MCLAARRRIGLLMRVDHLDAMIATLNKLLSFHLTLSKYDKDRSMHLRILSPVNIGRFHFFLLLYFDIRMLYT